MENCKHNFIDVPVEIDNFLKIEICNLCYKTKAEIELHNMRQHLKAIEWNSIRHIGPGEDGKLVYVSTCPVCNFSEKNGHDKNCWLINEIEKVQS